MSRPSNPYAENPGNPKTSSGPRGKPLGDGPDSIPEPNRKPPETSPEPPEVFPLEDVARANGLEADDLLRLAARGEIRRLHVRVGEEEDLRWMPREWNPEKPANALNLAARDLRSALEDVARANGLEVESSSPPAEEPVKAGILPLSMTRLVAEWGLARLEALEPRSGLATVAAFDAARSAVEASRLDVFEGRAGAMRSGRYDDNVFAKLCGSPAERTTVVIGDAMARRLVLKRELLISREVMAACGGLVAPSPVESPVVDGGRETLQRMLAALALANESDQPNGDASDPNVREIVRAASAHFPKDLRGVSPDYFERQISEGLALLGIKRKPGRKPSRD